jgi:hypothetical protein
MIVIVIFRVKNGETGKKETETEIEQSDSYKPTTEQSIVPVNPSSSVEQSQSSISTAPSSQEHTSIHSECTKEWILHKVCFNCKKTVKCHKCGKCLHVKTQ